MKTYRYIRFILLLIVTSIGCVKPVDPESLVFKDALVVEALLTNELKNQEVLLSRTFELNQHVRRPERSANVWIIREDGTHYNFYEIADGRYISDQPFAGDADYKYQLNIRTKDGNEFQSDEVNMMKATDLDEINVSFEPDPGSNEGTFRFTLNTGKSKSGSDFYRWKWVETYQVKVPKPSALIWDGTDLIRRKDARELQICYAYDSSKSILVAASNLESSDVLNYPIHSFHTTTQKLVLRYSIEVHQISISEQSFQFWELIRSNSEDQGSLYDNQPGTIYGNIRPINNTNMTVLGIFEASEITKARRFYNPEEFVEDGYTLVSNDIVNCKYEEPAILQNTQEVAIFVEENGDKYVPWYISSGRFDPPGILFISARCGDCRLHGSVEKPDFWID